MNKTLAGIAIAICSASLTFGFTQVANIGKIKDAQSDIKVTDARLDAGHAEGIAKIQAIKDDQAMLRKQVDDEGTRNEKRIGYIVTLMETNQKTVQELINILKVQNELLARTRTP